MNTYLGLRRLALTSVSALLMAAGLPIANAADAAGAADELDLTEVVVTARKQSERLIDVPLAITAISAEQIEQRGIKTLDDVAANTPGLTFSDVQAGFLPTPVIRGFAPVDVRGENSTGIFIDGVYVSGKEGLNFNQLDLERVEVIKGPQAALYGRNSFAGAINYVTAKPTNTFKGKAEMQFGSHDKIAATFTASGPIIADVLKGRISLSYDAFGGSYENQFGGIGGGTSNIGGWKYETASGTLVWTPSETFEGEFFGYVSNDILDNSAISPVQANCENTNSLLSTQTPTPPVAYLNYCGTFPAVGRNGLSAIPQATGNERHVARAHLTLKWDTPIGTLTSLTGYSKLNQTFNVDGSRNVGESVPFVYIARPATGLVSFAGGAFQAGNLGVFRTGLLQIGGGSNTEEISTELRLASKTDQAFRWSIGAYYYQTKADGGNDGVVATKALPADFVSFCLSCRLATALGGPAGLWADPTFVPGTDSTGFLPWFTSPTGDAIFSTTNTQKVSAPSGFGSIEYDFMEGLTGRVEGRYTREKKEFANLLTARSGDKSWGLKGYRATLDYKPSRNMTIYGSYGHAEKSGSVSAATVRFTTAPTVNVPILTAFDPEENNQLELGLKTAMLDGRLRLDFDIYQSKWKSIVIPQVRTELVNPATGTLTAITTPTAFNVNAGDATIRGAELQMEMRFSSHVEGGLGLSYIDASYDNAKIDSFKNMPSFSPLGDVSGKDLLRTSPVQVTANLGYTAPLADGRSWYLRGDASFRDKQYADAANEAITPSQTKVNVRLGLTSDNWSVELWATNLTNEDGPSAAYRDVYFSNALPDGTFYRTPGGTTPAGSGGKSTFFPWRYSVSYPQLREYGITARYKF